MIIIGDEEWHPIDDLPYLVSRWGEVLSLRRNRLLKAQVTFDGYLWVDMNSGTKRLTGRVHRLVYAAYGGVLIKGMEINHLDGNKKNNHISNLEQVTQEENRRHAIALGLMANGARNAARTRMERKFGGSQSGNAKLVEAQVPEIRRRRSEGESLAQLSADFGVTKSLISMIARRRIWRYI